MSVVFERTCVKTVARNMCHVVINIGKGKSIDDNTALLNKICIRCGSLVNNYAVSIVGRAKLERRASGAYHCAADRHPEDDVHKRLVDHP